MDKVLFRPRPNDILKADQIKQLKKDYKKKYEQIFKEEETQEKKVQTDILKEKKRIVREEFLSKFFLPLRRQYEENIGKYQ